MSREAALAFIKMAMKDESLQKSLVDLAAQHGFEFKIDELSEEELDAAAGGATTILIQTTTRSTGGDGNKGWINI